MFLPQETIRKKRDGRPLDRAEIAQFIHGVVEGSVGEGQIAAFAMATLLKGMSIEECVSLTLAMRDSGEVLDWRDLPAPWSTNTPRAAWVTSSPSFSDRSSRRAAASCP